MNHITRADVTRIAHLSRIRLSEEEVETFSGQLESIIAFVEKLSAVNIEGVEPFLNAAADGNIFRDDKQAPSLPRIDGLANAADKDEGFFRVPEVLEG